MIPFNDGIEVLSPRAGTLAGRGANFTSQFGEDGLIAAALEEFGAANKWCFEVGANDGVFYSNTARLRDEGWSCVLIEAEAEHFDKLRTLNGERVFTIPKRINKDSLNEILKDCGAPRNLDLGVIDIDGQDYWIWDGLKAFRPRLMLIEFDYRSDDKPDWFPALNEPGQATRKAIERLGRDKGYELLARTHVNLLFADSGIL